MLPRTGFGFEANDMKYYDDACVIIFLNQSYTLDITTIAQRYSVRKIKNVKSEDIPGRAYYVEAGSWFPFLTNGETEITLGSTPEPMQAATPTTGLTRHSSSIYSSANGYNHTPTPATDEPHTMEVDAGGLGAGRRAGVEMGSTDLTQYDRLQGAVARLMLDHEAMHATQTSTALALEDLGKQLHESQRQHPIDIQELHEGHHREMAELRIQQEQMVKNEIATSFQQMSLRAEFHQRLLHLEAALRDVHG